MTEFTYQLYSSRNHGPLDKTLAMLATAGYAGVEGYGGIYEGLDAGALAALRAALDAVGLRMPTGHVSLALIETEPARAVALAQALGIGALFVPFLPPAERPRDAAGWQAFGRRLGRAGAPIRAAGLRFGWHNHDFEFQPLDDGSMPIAHLLDAAPELDWEADIAWIARGGADPFPWIERYAPRITAVHVKDIAPAGEKADEDGWADVGTGTLPWARLMAVLGQGRARHFVMEHDNPRDDAAFARASIAAARNY